MSRIASRDRTIAMLALALCLFLPGCPTRTPNPYALSEANILALRSANGGPVSVGAFSNAEGVDSKFLCPGAGGTIKPPNGLSMAEYLRGALMAELQVAGLYAADAPRELTGTVESVSVSGVDGFWAIELKVASSGGAETTVRSEYRFEPGSNADLMCARAAQKLLPATQAVILALVTDGSFEALLGETGR